MSKRDNKPPVDDDDDVSEDGYDPGDEASDREADAYILDAKLNTD